MTIDQGRKRAGPHGFAWHRLLLLSWLFLAFGCGGNGLSPIDEDESLSGPHIPYAVVLEGVDDAELHAFLLSASSAAQSVDRPPPSLVILRNRARADLPRLEAGLAARGYYDGRVAFRIDHDEGAEIYQSHGMFDTLLGISPPTRIVYEIAPGERYAFDNRGVRVVGEGHGYTPPRALDIGLRQGNPAIADAVLEAEASLLRHARMNGHPMASLERRETVIDRDTHVMDVELAIAPGPRLAFARPAVTGASEIDERFLLGRLLIEPGEPYDIRAVEQARRRLIDTNLFSTVRVIEGPEPDASGGWPVRFEVGERLHRTIGAGVGFRSDDGPNVRAFWEHRNILGAGERLRIEAEASQSLQRLEAQLRKPDIFMPDLDVVGGGALRREDTDAFESLSISGNLGLERRFTNRLTGTAGVAYRLSEVTDQDGEERFALLSLPVGMRYDASDDLLDPTTGYRILLEAAPTWDTFNPGTTFVKNRLIATRYFRLRNNPRLVLAFRGAAGAIIGAETSEIPADERFYSGGGGSIRGIPFQMAGPISDGDPTGGRSVLEANAEVRYQILQSLEAVLFLDGGSAFEEELPQFGDAWQYGTGAGIRYLTPVGPIRVDVGVPIDKRDGIDDAWQLYISIGQAF